jgi:hypothetical protein
VDILGHHPDVCVEELVKIADTLIQGNRTGRDWNEAPPE